MSNFILNVFLYLLLFLIKLALKFKDFPALTSVFKDFQGIEIRGLSRTFKGRANPVGPV